VLTGAPLISVSLEGLTIKRERVALTELVA
jgi:hypothetical protein